MTFPFPITQEIRWAYQAHIDYISAGQKWLIRNDPEGQNEQVLLEEIQTAIRNAAQEHFGDDEDAEYEFYDKIGLTDVGARFEWYDILEEELKDFFNERR